MRRDSDGFGCINQVTVGNRYAKRLQIAYIYTQIHIMDIYIYNYIYIYKMFVNNIH
jgi:hypothetical protein